MQKTSIAHPHITLETVTGAAVEAEVAVKTLLKQKKVLLKMLCRCWTQTSSFFQFIVWVVEAVLASEARGGSGTRGRWSIENFVWCSNWNDGSKQPEKQQSCSRNNSRKCLIFCILILYFLGVTVVYLHKRDLVTFDGAKSWYFDTEHLPNHYWSDYVKMKSIYLESRLKRCDRRGRFFCATSWSMKHLSWRSPINSGLGDENSYELF